MPDGGEETGESLYARYCAACHKSDRSGQPPEFPSLVDIAGRRSVDEVASIVYEGGGRMPAFAQLHGAARRAIVRYVMSGESETVRADKPSPFDLKYSLDGNARFTDPDGFPAVTPPWGTLTAIDLNKASIAWQVPLGEMPGSGVPNSGSENYGGPVVTASGLLFIARHELRQQVPRVRRAHRARPVGDDAAGGGECDARGLRRERQAVHRDRRRRGQMGRGVRRHVCRVCLAVTCRAFGSNHNETQPQKTWSGGYSQWPTIDWGPLTLRYRTWR